MPSSSWPPIGRSCSDANQPGSGTDIELCVAGSVTSSSGRSHRAARPLQPLDRGRRLFDAAAGEERGRARAAIRTVASSGTAMRRTGRPARRSAGLYVSRSSTSTPL